MQEKEPEKIQAATLRARAVKYELNKTQQLEVAGLTSSSPKDPYYAKVLNRGNPITDKRSAPAGQTLAYNINARQTPKPPDIIRQVNTNDSSVASMNNHWLNDLHCMVNMMLAENRDMIPEDSIVVKTNLSIPSPEEYLGSPDLEVYKTFVAGILRWLRLNGLLGEDNTAFQVEYLGMRLKGNALEWYTRNDQRHDQPIRDWSLEAVIEGLQKCFLNTLTHRQVSIKFNTIKQGKHTVQELYQDLTKYAAHMVQYLLGQPKHQVDVTQADDGVIQREKSKDPSSVRPSIYTCKWCNIG